jgi:hypothetical protein
MSALHTQVHEFSKNQAFTLNNGIKSAAYLVIGPATTIDESSFPVRSVQPFVLIMPTVGLCPYTPQ